MGGKPPLQESDLIFPSATNDIKTTLHSLKRSNLSITNRLHSIKSDADFVQSVSQTFQLPLIANERCGSWYIQPSIKAGSAYFKSTDGHFGQWGFSLRRLNLQILDVVGRGGGCIIVDSTRRGKSMPDALSKTIPVWICALNRLLFPERRECHALRTPPDVVSESEHSQIEERLASFLEDLRSLDLDMGSLRSKLGGIPLQPVWVTPASGLDAAIHDVEEGCHPVVLCTASSRASQGLDHSTSTSTYVQGAADDSESWAHGLDAAAFWAHHEELLSAPEDDLPSLIATLLATRTTAYHPMRRPTLIKPTTNIFIADSAAVESLHPDFDIIISCSPNPNSAVSMVLKSRYIHLACSSTAKIGSRQLRAQLPKIERSRQLLRPDSRILVTCPTGKDLAVGVALAMICIFCQPDGSLRVHGGEGGVSSAALSKTVIKHRLSWIMISMPDAAPSRATLQSVNAFLLS